MRELNFSRTIYFFTLIIFCISLFISCAQIVAPGGGKKDLSPPRALNFVPDSAQTNFPATEIKITFDEFIQLKDLNNQLVVSPPLNYKPEIIVKNKSVEISLNAKEILKINTTYSFNFGSAIQDITENNVLENFRYIFSTGSFIDSLFLKGKVQLGFNHSTEKGVLVMLYSNFDDSVIYNQLPEYFSKTNQDGTFRLTNLKKGKYKIVALKDGNANYKYDEGESIGFIDAPIDVSEKQNILIDLFNESPKKLFLKKSIYESFGKIVFVFNKPTNMLLVEALNFKFNSADTLLDFSKNKDTLTFWFRNIEQDKLKLRLLNDGKVLDTIEYKLISKEEALQSKKHPLKLSMLNKLNKNQIFELGNNLKLIFNSPLAADSRFDNFIFEENNIDLKQKKQLGFSMNSSSEITLSEIINDTLKGKKYVFDYHILPPILLELKPMVFTKENTSYKIIIPPGALVDFFGTSNDSIKMNFKTNEEKYYGSVKLKVEIPENSGNYILQLLDENEKIIRESLTNIGTTINYLFLAPQTYKLKLIYDSNGNGIWTTGNYKTKLQPEKVVYYSGMINIRSNWDLDLKWEINTNQ